jgi:NCS2 family nucleobase:cation symporter-2
MHDAAWVRPEPRSLAGGVTADGVATVLAGLMGAPAVNMSPTGVAIQSATGVTSRIIALGVGALAVLVACSPRLTALLALVPGPVIAGVLVHAGALMMANGMQVTTSRMMDARRSQVVGLSILAALAVETLPQLAASAPALLRPVLSAAACGTLVALLLNAALRIGVRRQVSLTVPADAIIEAEVADFATRAGASWGARPEVVARAAELVSWCLDAIIHSGLARGPVTVKLAFDEFRLDVLISYRGAPIELAETAPTPDELLDDDGAAARLAGHMIRRRAERAAIRSRDGTTELRLALDH